MNIIKLFEYTARECNSDIKINKNMLNLIYDSVWQIATDKYIGVINDEGRYLITPAFTIKLNEPKMSFESSIPYMNEFPSMQLNCICVDRYGTFKNGWWLSYVEPTKFFRPGIYETWNIAQKTPEILKLSHLRFWGYNYGQEQIERHRKI